MIEDVRELILDYVHDEEREYEVIFTANASSAIRLVAEAFPFQNKSRLLLTEDNHNSIHGIREFARRAGAGIEYAPLVSSELRVDDTKLTRALSVSLEAPSLFAMPGQSNLSGVKHRLHYLQQAKSHDWITLLDAAAFMPTNELNLTEIKPDFVCLSFYKMFGYPTGIGCLLAKKEALALLDRPWFAGGSVASVSVSAKCNTHIPAAGVEAFEDGTVNFAMIPAVADGLLFMKRLGIKTIQKRTQILTAWFLQEMNKLLHNNGLPLIIVLGPKTMEGRGATVAFLVQDNEGDLWPSQLIEELASESNISIRTGYHCNPGCIERIYQLSRAEEKYLYDDQQSEEERLCRQQEKMPGVIRISLGLVSNFSDIWQARAFLATLLNSKRNELGATK